MNGKINSIFPCYFISVIIMFSGFAFGKESKSDVNEYQSDFTELEQFFGKTIESQKFAALGARLIKDNKVIWEGYYGYSDMETEKKLGRDNIFQLASLSKVVTATAIMQLYEKKLFDLDDDINKYLPMEVRNPNFPEKPITFRMLLTHTATFDDVTSTGLKVPKNVARPQSSNGDSGMSLEEYIEGLLTPGGKYYSAEYFSLYEPGTKYGYSNIAFSLIGYLVEKISGQDFSEYCKANIFEGLEMKNTGWHLMDIDINKVAFGYCLSIQDNTPSYRKVQHFGEPGYPAGMLRTTIPDFTNFISAFINNGRYKDFQLLKPETLALMLTPQGVKNIPSRSFPIKDIGLAWLMQDIEGVEYYTMNGFAGSIFANAYFSQKDSCGIIYYYTGVSMKNMPAMIGITKELNEALKDN